MYHPVKMRYGVACALALTMASLAMPTAQQPPPAQPPQPAQPAVPAEPPRRSSRADTRHSAV